MSSVTGWICTPRKPRSTLPPEASSATTFAAVSEGTAKPMPTEPPVGEKIAVLIPTTSPSVSKSGPPELPLLIAASVWM